MTLIEQSALLPYSADRLFDLVNDIEAYPVFMDGCLGAQVIERRGNEIIARLELGKVGLHYAFTTRNTLNPGQSMVMELEEGPFKHFDATWTFKALGDAACRVSLKMEFEFSASLLDIALKRLFESTSRNLVNAICKRADEIYGE